jgi:uncharacterized protein (TIGR02757 family)
VVAVPENPQNIRNILERLVDLVNVQGFIENDPVSVPHRYFVKQDIEISAFFTAIFSWGSRKSIISKSLALMQLMDDSPYEFILHHTDGDLRRLTTFVHRTFQTEDLLYFIDFLSRHYRLNPSLESAFYTGDLSKYNQGQALHWFRCNFFNVPYALIRTRKHISDPMEGSACKRLNMFLRWMVRQDDRKVDFGIWKNIPASGLMIPLDVHVERYARRLGLLTRRQRDWKAVEELTNNLRNFDPLDPVKYDYALFGLGAGCVSIDTVF